MAGLLFFGGYTLFLGVLSVQSWNESRCTSKEAWFHNWINTGKERTVRYEKDGQEYTTTSATMKCSYCNVERDMVIADTGAEKSVDFGDDCGSY